MQDKDTTAAITITLSSAEGGKAAGLFISASGSIDLVGKDLSVEIEGGATVAAVACTATAALSVSNANVIVKYTNPPNTVAGLVDSTEEEITFESTSVQITISNP